MSATAGTGLSDLGGYSKKSFQTEGATMLQIPPLHSGLPADPSAQFPQQASSISNLLYPRSKDESRIWTQLCQIEVFKILLG